MTQEYFATADQVTTTFYDTLATDYAAQYENWLDESRTQAAVLDPIIRGATGAGPVRILDTACGIGTQALGLALLGHTVTGIDLSAAAVDEARVRIAEAGVDLPVEVADFRDLSALPIAAFDAVICCDNALPHLLDDDDLRAALRTMADRLRPDGLFLASIRDYDLALDRRVGGQAPRTYRGPDGTERLLLQMWEWESESVYRLRHLMLHRDGDTAWSGREHNVYYRAIRRAELSVLAIDAGLVDPQWHMPAETGFFQPLLVARARA